MAQPVKVIIVIDGKSSAGGHMAIPPADCAAFAVGDLIDDAVLVARKWSVDGECVLQLELRCETTSVVADKGQLEDNSSPYAEETVDVVRGATRAKRKKGRK